MNISDNLEKKKTLKQLNPIEKKHENVERILKERKLKKEAERLLKEAEKVSNKIKKLSMNCNHKILIFMKYEKYKDEFIPAYTCKCLFCNEVIVNRKYMPEDMIKHMEEASYIRIVQRTLDPEETISVLQDIYIRKREKYPNESEKQIAKKMIEEIKEKKLYKIEE